MTSNDFDHVWAGEYKDSKKSKLTIHKPEGSENSPHDWTIIHSSGIYIASPMKLVDEARAEQAAIIQAMVDAYNLAYCKGQENA